MDVLKAFVSGVVVIGLVAAIGMHGSGLASVIKNSGTAAQGVLGTAETGKA